MLPIDSKVKSDFLKPSSLLKKKEELEELSEMLGVKVSKKDTYASIDKRINDKFQIIKNQKILESGNYDKLFKDTAKTQIDQAQPVKEMLFNLQQMHNGNSSGEYKSKDGGRIMPYGGKVTALKENLKRLEQERAKKREELEKSEWTDDKNKIASLRKEHTALNDQVEQLKKDIYREQYVITPEKNQETTPVESKTISYLRDYVKNLLF